jgi:hypothetical protein
MELRYPCRGAIQPQNMIPRIQLPSFDPALRRQPGMTLRRVDRLRAALRRWGSMAAMTDHCYLLLLAGPRHSMRSDLATRIKGEGHIQQIGVVVDEDVLDRLRALLVGRQIEGLHLIAHP